MLLEREVRWILERGMVRKPAEIGADVFGLDGFPFAERYVGGESRDEVLDYAASLNEDGITALVDLLGEHVEDSETAEDAADEYRELQDRIVERELDAHLSVKPTHLGLDVADRDDPYAFCRDHVADLAGQADEHDRVLWLDMESTAYTDDTIRLYTDLQEEYGNLGVCLQSYLERSGDDIDDLVDAGGRIRLVKGAYPTDADYTGEELNDRYRELLETLLGSDVYVAVATHDPVLIDDALDLVDEYDRDQDTFEFQFLKGVRDDRKPELVEDGYTVTEYVPYGPDWFDYLWRRVQEDPQNLKKVLLS